MNLPYTLKAAKLMVGDKMRQKLGRDMTVDDLPVYEDIDLTTVERQLAFVDGAGDMIELCEGDEPTQLAIAEDCNAHYANEYLTRAFISLTAVVS